MKSKSDRCIHTSMLSASITELSVCTFVQTDFFIYLNVNVYFHAYPHILWCTVFFKSYQGLLYSRF